MCVCFFNGDHFKVFIEFVTILLLFYVLVFWSQNMRDLAPQPGIKPEPPTLESKVLINHWITREVLTHKDLTTNHSSKAVHTGESNINYGNRVLIFLSYTWEI